MFYFHEILKKRGKFGVIWLAATVPKRLKRREILSVDVSKSSNDVIEVLTLHTSMCGRKNVYFSLYLSSQLMFGLAAINRKQSDLLLSDIKALARRLASFEQLSSVDLLEPTSGFRVTFDEPDYENVPIDFGSFSINDASTICEPSYEFFIVSTPQSSDEWRVSPGWPDEFRFDVDDTEQRFIARPEDITMPKAPQQVEEHIPYDIPATVPDIDFLEDPFGLSLMPTAVERIPEAEPELQDTEPVIKTNGLAAPEILDVALPAAPEAEVPIPQLDIPDLRTPDIPDLRTPDIPDLRTPDVPETLPKPVKRKKQLQRDDVSSLPSPEHVKKSKRTRSPRVQEQSEISFQLEPTAVQSRRRRRRRYLLVDAETTLSQNVIRNNINSAGINLVRPLTIPELRETTESMLTRFGLRAAAHGNRKFWRNLKTLPEPNDPSIYGRFIQESPEVSQERPFVEDKIADVSVPMETQEEEEILREGETREQIADEYPPDYSRDLSKTLISSRQSRLLQDTRDQTSTPGVSLPVSDDPSGYMSRIRDDAEALDDEITDSYIKELLKEPEVLESQMHLEKSVEVELPEQEPEEQEPEEQEPEEQEPEEQEPEEQEPEEQGISAKQTRKSRVCVLPREEKTPPPPSPEEPTSPLVETAMQYIKETFADSPVSNLISFTDVLTRTPRTRKYVAKMFNLILNLHSSGFIFLDQQVTDGEIFISKGTNYDEF